MILSNIIDRQLRALCEGHFPEALRGYLLAKYREEPFPYQFTEEDLYEHIRQDIQDYKAGRLDVTQQPLGIDYKQELEELQHSYLECLSEVRELSGYIDKLEALLLEHSLESPRVVKQRLKQQADPYLF